MIPLGLGSPMADSSDQIAQYLASLPDEMHRTLARFRAMVRRLFPQAEEAMSYGMPAFRLHGATVLGYRGATHHYSVFPFSGQTLAKLSEHLQGYDVSKGAIRFPPTQLPPASLIRRIIQTRLREIEALGSSGPKSASSSRKRPKDRNDAEDNPR